MNSLENDICVLLPVFEDARHVIECIDCLKRQTLKTVELRILLMSARDKDALEIDNASLGGNGVVIADERKSSLGEALNRAIDETACRYLAVVNPENLLTDSALEKLMAIADSNYCEIVCCGCRTVAISRGKTQLESYIIPGLFDENGGAFLEDESAADLITNGCVLLISTGFASQNGIRFAEIHGSKFSAMSFAFESLCRAKRVGAVREPLLIRRLSTLFDQPLPNAGNMLLEEFRQLRIRLEGSSYVWRKSKNAYYKVKYHACRQLMTVVPSREEIAFIEDMANEFKADYRIGVFRFRGFTLQEKRDLGLAMSDSAEYYQQIHGNPRSITRKTLALFADEIEQLAHSIELLKGTAPGEEGSKQNQTLTVIAPIDDNEGIFSVCSESLLAQDHPCFEVIFLGADLLKMSNAPAISCGLESKLISPILLSDIGLPESKRQALKATNGDYICLLGSNDMLSVWSLRVFENVARKYKLDLLLVKRRSYGDIMNWQSRTTHLAGFPSSDTRASFAVAGPEMMRRLQRSCAFDPADYALVISNDFLAKNNSFESLATQCSNTAFSFECISSAKRAACLVEPHYIKRIDECSIANEDIAAKAMQNRFKVLIKILSSRLSRHIGYEAEKDEANSVGLLIESCRETYSQLNHSHQQLARCLPPIEQRLFDMLITQDGL